MFNRKTAPHRHRCATSSLLQGPVSSAPTLPSFGPANMLISGANNRVSDWQFPLIQFDLHFFLKNGNEKPMHLIHGEESAEIAAHIRAWLRPCEREQEPGAPLSCAWPAPHHSSSCVLSLFLPRQGLALSTEAAPWSASLPTIARCTQQ